MNRFERINLNVFAAALFVGTTLFPHPAQASPPPPKVEVVGPAAPGEHDSIVTRPLTPPDIQKLIDANEALAAVSTNLPPETMTTYGVPPNAQCISLPSDELACAVSQTPFFEPPGTPREIYFTLIPDPDLPHAVLWTQASRTSSDSFNPYLLQMPTKDFTIIHQEKLDDGTIYLRQIMVDQVGELRSSNEIPNTYGATGFTTYTNNEGLLTIDFQAPNFDGSLSYWTMTQNPNTLKWTIPQGYSLSVELATTPPQTSTDSPVTFQTTLRNNSETAVRVELGNFSLTDPPDIALDTTSQCTQVVGATPVDRNTLLFQIAPTCPQMEAIFSVQTNAPGQSGRFSIQANARDSHQSLSVDYWIDVFNGQHRTHLPLIVR